MAKKTRKLRYVGTEESRVLLLKWQRSAYAIRGGVCHCPMKAVMLSYLLKGWAGQPAYTGRRIEIKGETHEECGFYCGTCGFSNAGARPVIPAAPTDPAA